MKLDIEKVKIDLQEILVQSCMFEQDNRQTMEKCVRTVKIYLDKNKSIKSYRVNCHTKQGISIITAHLTVEMKLQDGKNEKIELSLWPEPVPLTFEDRKPNIKSRK